MPNSFTTDRLGAFRLTYEDAEEIFYTYASKPEATKFVSWPTHERICDTNQFLGSTTNGWVSGVDYSYGIRLSNNRLIGSCGLLNDRGRIQFGYVFSPTCWGNGYATEVCSRFMEIIRMLPQIASVGTFIDAENGASGRVLEKSGLVIVERRQNWFSFVNQNGAVKDCVLYGLPMMNGT